MARKKKRSAPKARDPFAYCLAVKTGSAAGRHKQGRRKPKGKGSRSQREAKAIRNY